MFEGAAHPLRIDRIGQVDGPQEPIQFGLGVLQEQFVEDDGPVSDVMNPADRMLRPFFGHVLKMILPLWTSQKI